MVKISVVMPAYNAEKYIGQAIESILNQTYRDFELIIVNDGSTDNTKNIILSYKDERIIYLENEKNSGIVITLNKGLDNAKGEYIARMDADDISKNDRFEKQIDFLEKNKEIALLGSGICIFGENTEETNRVFTNDSEQLKAELIFNSSIAHPTVMIRKSVLDENNLRYNVEFAGAEDYYLWWEISKKGKICTLSDILLNYRIHSSQITKKKDARYFSLMRRLMETRFNDIGFMASDKYKDAFMTYCLGEFEKFTPSSVHIFIECLKEILNVNFKNQFFSQKKLVKIFELAIIFALNNSSLTTEEKRREYNYSVRIGMFTFITRLKLMYHKMLR